MTKKAILILVLVLSFFYGKSQSSLISFPTPEASELGKYGQVPVSYFNGLPEISIPLYTLTCKDIELPLSLSYYAAGNKPDEHPGWVGLGWNLNAGGMITRIVNGIRDELCKEDYQKEVNINGPSGFESGYYYRASDFNNDNWSTTLLQELAGTNPLYHYLDSQPDEFVFNFNGHSGSFFFVYENGQMQVKVKSKNGDILKVEPTLFAGTVEFPVFTNWAEYHKYGTTLKVFKTFRKFVITTTDGYKYEFGGDIANIDFSTINNEITTASSWHLSKIISPTGNFINFEYKQGGNVYIQKKSTYSYESYSPNNPNPCVVSKNDVVDGLSLTLIHPKYLSKIATSTGQTIRFISSKTTELDYDNWSTAYSNYTTVFNALLSSQAYNSWDSSRLNDHYYLELDRIVVDSLKTIDFSYTKNRGQRLRLLGLSVVSYDNIDGLPINLSDGITDSKYTFYYNNTMLPPYNSRQTDNWGFYNNKSYSSINDYSTLFNARQPDLPYTKAEILEKIKYPTGGATEFEYELNTYSKVVSGLEISTNPFALTQVSGTAGGLRIKTITSYKDSLDRTDQIKKEFSYNQSDGSTSSGILSGLPVYNISGSQHVNYKFSGWSGLCYYSGQADQMVTYLVCSQNLLLPLHTTNGNHVTYSKVTVNESDGSKTIYSYTNHDDFMDEPPLQVITNIDSKVINDAFTSKELERGLLKSVEFFKSGNRRVRSEHYTYNDDANRYNNFVKTLNQYVQPAGSCSSVDFVRLSANKIYTFYPYLKTKTEISYNINGADSVTKVTRYAYNAYNLPSTVSQTGSKSPADSLTVITKYPFDNTGAIYNQMTNRFQLNDPVEVVRYRGSNIIEGKLTTYKQVINATDTMYLPDKLHVLELTSPLSAFTPYNGTTMDSHYGGPNLEYVTYGPHGNVYETKDNKGISTTYLWSYSHQYPVAKIEGLTYDEVKAAVGEQLINGLAQKAWPTKEEIEQIRNNISTNINGKAVLISTCTYAPFIGMTSFTDPRGVTTHYNYDAIGRLKLRRNDDQQLLNNYNYHYKAQ